jgi:ABC-type transport system involved in multi-copper enzyme maturation permease subunit
MLFFIMLDTLHPQRFKVGISIAIIYYRIIFPEIIICSKGCSMLKTIIIRELLDYIKTTKFLIGLLLTTILVVIVTSVNIVEYSARQQAFLDSTREPSSQIVYREPQPLSIFVQGIDLNAGDKKTLQIRSMLSEDRKSDDLTSFLQTSFNFGNIDLSFIISIIMSLLVIFFAYDSFSGEKEQGTLRQSLANSLPRWKVVMGKLLGGFGTITVFLAFSMLVASLIVSFYPRIQFTADDWIRVFLIFFVSIQYLAVFYTLGIMVSIITNRSAATLLVLVQLWIVLTIVVPNGSSLIIQLINPVKIPTIEEMSIQIAKINAEENKEHNELGIVNTNEKAYQRGIINKKYSEKMYSQVYLPKSNILTREAKQVQSTKLLSPTGIYERIVSRLAKTDFDEYDFFQQGVFNYWKTASAYNLYSTFSEHVEIPEELQVTESPVFSYQSEKTGESLARMCGLLFMLFLWTVIFFLTAHAAFLRKDVR